jgi:hypothetical protein
VGSYGPEFADWAAQRFGMHPKRTTAHRWWQLLVSYRALEHDADGRLVWDTVVLSTSRQSGKSWLLRELCLWRLDLADRLGEVQTVVHTAAQLKHAFSVFAPAGRWAAHQGYRVRWANGEQAIQAEDGSTWLIQAANDGLGVSLSVGLGLVDEAWDVPRELVEQGLAPTQAEAADPQLWLVSTAGVPRVGEASDLMPVYRRAGMDQLGGPVSTLLVEWSAAGDADVDDPAVWRSASPFWDERRQMLVERKRVAATTAAALQVFRTQWLNQWPDAAAAAVSWLPAQAVAACGAQRVVPGGRAAAVERRIDADVFSAVFGGASGVEVLSGASLDGVRSWLQDRDPEVVLCHQAVGNLLDGFPLRVVRAGEVSAAVTVCAEAVRAGRVQWDNPVMVEEQFADVVVVPGEHGPRIVAQRSRGDVSAVKSLSWLLWWESSGVSEVAAVF